MEIPNFTTLYTPSHRPSLYSSKPSNYPLNSFSLYHNRCMKPSRFRRKPIKISYSSSSLRDSGNADIWADSDCVEVIGIGSRVDSVLDFCLRSPSSSQSLRFWNVMRGESLRGQLHQRILGKDNCPNIVDVPLDQQSHLKAVVLVASAGYGDDYVIATDILRTISSGSGLVVAVILKPFSFEGQRRKEEVKILVDRLQDCVNFHIGNFMDQAIEQGSFSYSSLEQISPYIDIDTLLKMDLVTLDEALKTAYRAVSSAITAVSVLVSDRYKKHIHHLHGGVRQITANEVIKVLEKFNDGKVGFGVGHNVEASIIQAVYDCPFLCMGLKELDGMVICILSSCCAVGDNDVYSLLHTFRQATECTKEVILSTVHDPDMKPNLIATTVVTVCASAAESKSRQKSSILSRLADSIPFVFNFLRRHHIQSGTPNKSNSSEISFPPLWENLTQEREEPNMVPVEGTTENVGKYSGNEMLLVENRDGKECDDDGTDGVGYLDTDDSSSNCLEQNVEGAQDFVREPLIDRNFGPGYRIAHEWAAEEVNASGAIPVVDNPRNFRLPVGVRTSDDFQDSLDTSKSRRPVEKIIVEDAKGQPSPAPSSSSLNECTDGGLEVVNDFWNNASTLLRGNQPDFSKKQGNLSARAASMLETERDSKTRWTPVMQIRYRGGIYKGRCQGGLPEGRGRLTFLDGSVYDGTWRYGKRSGLGSLFFSNGDVFHGSWRDDLMHGKGWLYFHSGERWFANFWKGRANGEGRFYSKSGEVFFGQFQDGWRHGRFLCVKVDGTRYTEIWNEGVLVRCEELDS